MQPTSFQDRVRDRARPDMEELAREELARLSRAHRPDAAAADPTQIVDAVLDDMLPGLSPILGEVVAALLLRAGVVEHIDARFGAVHA